MQPNVRHDDDEIDTLPSGEVLGYVARTTVLADEAIELLERGETDRAIAAHPRDPLDDAKGGGDMTAAAKSSPRIRTRSTRPPELTPPASDSHVSEAPAAPNMMRGAFEDIPAGSIEETVAYVDMLTAVASKAIVRATTATQDALSEIEHGYEVQPRDLERIAKALRKARHALTFARADHLRPLVRLMANERRAGVPIGDVMAAVRAAEVEVQS